MDLQHDEIIYAVYLAFSNTKYGRQLSGKLRYEQYNFGHLGSSEWVRLLGVDVNNLAHMLITYSLAKSFTEQTLLLKPSSLSESEQELLLIAAIIHDQAEAIVGDITFGRKGKSDEAAEQKAFAEHLQAFTPGLSDEVRQLVQRAKDEVLFTTDSKLGEMFNIIERVGYLRTALRAAEIIREKKAFRSVAQGLQWLITDVLTNQTETLLKFATTYGALQQYLSDEAANISYAFSLNSDEVFDNYGNDKEAKQQQFRSALEAWKAFS